MRRTSAWLVVITLCTAVALFTTGTTEAQSTSCDAENAETVASDFNGDGHDDLVVGVPEEDVNGQANAGGVNVVYTKLFGDGPRRDLNFGTSNSNVFFSFDTDGIAGKANTGDRLGMSTATGDFNGDGYDDLAIGAPYDDANSESNSGSVVVIPGSSSGLRASNSVRWTQAELVGWPEAADLFGYSLAAGDFDLRGYDDLAIGAPLENVESHLDAGMVNVVHGSPSGLHVSAVTPEQYWHQDTTADGVPTQGYAETGDRFGWSMAAGNFDAFSGDDLAIGSPGEDVEAIGGAGSVNVIYAGAASGTVAHRLRGTSNALYHQGDSTDSVEGSAEAADAFGFALAAGYVDGYACADLVIGVPGESVGSISKAGAMQVLYGRTGKTFFFSANQMWTQDSGGIPGGAETEDQFGYSVAVGRRGNGDFSYRSVAVGAPQEDFGGNADSGAVIVFTGASAGITSDRSFLLDQGDTEHDCSRSGLTEIRDYSHRDEFCDLEGNAEPGDNLGFHVAFQMFENDGPRYPDFLNGDLVIGIPGENNSKGFITILGGQDGLDYLRSQESEGVAGNAESGDRFGFAVGGSHEGT